jgi:hypothetical protein
MPDQDAVASPVSPVDHSSIIMMLHQLQQDIADIRQALNVDQDMGTVMSTGMAAGNQSVIMTSEQQQICQPVGVSRWTRPLAEIQEAQGILRRLHRNSNKRNVVV